MISLENERSNIITSKKKIQYKLLQISKFHGIITLEEKQYYETIGQMYDLYAAENLIRSIKKDKPIDRIMHNIESVDIILENIDSILHQIKMFNDIETKLKVDNETFMSLNTDNISLLHQLLYELDCLLTWKDFINDFFSLYHGLLDLNYFNLNCFNQLCNKGYNVFILLQEKLTQINNNGNAMDTYITLELMQKVTENLCIIGSYRNEIFFNWNRMREWLIKNHYPNRKYFFLNSHFRLLNELMELLNEYNKLNEPRENNKSIINLDDIFNSEDEIPNEEDEIINIIKDNLNNELLEK